MLLLDLRAPEGRLKELGLFLTGAFTPHYNVEPLTTQEAAALKAPKTRWQISGALVKKVVWLLYSDTQSETQARYVPMLTDQRQKVFDILHWEKA